MLSAESLQSNHQLYSSAATFMIEQGDDLFNVPEKVVQDILAYGDRKHKGNKSTQMKSITTVKFTHFHFEYS